MARAKHARQSIGGRAPQFHLAHLAAHLAWRELQQAQIAAARQQAAQGEQQMPVHNGGHRGTAAAVVEWEGEGDWGGEGHNGEGDDDNEDDDDDDYECTFTADSDGHAVPVAEMEDRCR